MVACVAVYIAVAVAALGAIAYTRFANSPEPLALILRELGSPLAAQYLAVSAVRSEEHTSELQSLMRISYAVFCLKNKITLIISSIHHADRSAYKLDHTIRYRLSRHKVHAVNIC